MADLFTIIVEQRGAEEVFGFGDLVLRHGECEGGQITQKEDSFGRWWWLKCRRCSCKVQLFPDTDTTVAIALTSIDGTKRSLDRQHPKCAVVRSAQ
jgi:hypothetical protein